MAYKLKQLVTLSLSVLVSVNVALGEDCGLNATFTKEGIDAVYPGDGAYQNASQPFNLRVPYQPVAITYPKNTEDVVKIVNASASCRIPVSARSGGHSYAAYGLGGNNGHLVVDLSHITDIVVDVNSTAKSAVIGAGNRLGNVSESLFNQSRRAMPHGTCPRVGIGGHASYGGYGFTSRQWGLTLDNIVGLTMVLANGTKIEANSSQYSDIFWAARGAAPSFGIITHFHVNTYAAPERPTFFDYQWSLPPNQTMAAISAYQNLSLSSSIPAEIGFELNLRKGNSRGDIRVDFLGSYYGAPENFSAIVQPFLDAMPTPPLNTTVENTTWIEHLKLLADGPPRLNDTFYAKSLMTPSNVTMSQEAITAFVTQMSTEGWDTSTDWFVQLELYGGTNSRIPKVLSNATAFANRNTLWTIQFYASSANHLPPYPDEGISFLDGLVNSVTEKESSTWKYGAYTNYVDPLLTTSQWHSLYYGTNYARLHSIKQVVDPNGVFTFPQSIPRA
ncbi:Glucooligosaccharide oxidase [Daedalea quercina L-15889]|uniref:Glucooligosaccharide oxidase n=1 Tax=Daedalea quercina L-15889 TaxID=1314783 RepID=A0A165L8L7_9APHY|nr:Glucooligosaccharide oxidase [Daedalea quercina L-15889]